MPITGAIFDFDGTIVDSMPMWETVTDEVLGDLDVTIEPEMLARMELMSVRDLCRALADTGQAPGGEEALYQRFCEQIRNHYVTSIRMYDGCRKFLEELLVRGVRMVVATSSPSREVRAALAAHGIEDLFLDVVSTEDEGIGDKSGPDVFLKALEVLGTDVSTTWVFEDAPFGARSAREAGFHTVGMLTGPDQRRHEAISPFCDITVHGYAELSLALIDDFADVPSETRGVMRALVVDGSPQQSSDDLVARLAADADYVIAADRGAEALWRVGVAPDVFCGDSDSVTPEAAAWARASAKTTIGFPSEKYATDLALAIDCACHEASRRGMSCELTVTCASGGRPDHFFAVVGLLANHAVLSPRLVEDGCEMRVLAAGPAWAMGEKAVGGTFSAVAVADGTVVSERGMQWELDESPMALLDDVGVSNVVVSPCAQVTCHAGAVACWLFEGQR